MEVTADAREYPAAAVVIVAAGSGQRMGGGTAKQLRLLQGIPVLMRSCLPFQAASFIQEIILVVPAGLEDTVAGWVTAHGCDKVTRIVQGGGERSASVRAGLSELASSSADIIMVHDGARPFVKVELIAQVMSAAYRYGAAIPVLPVVEAVKLVGDETVIRSLERTYLRVAQTPQAFRTAWIRDAYQRRVDLSGADDAWLVEACGYPVHTVAGHRENIKLTYTEDWFLGEKLLSGSAAGCRVGLGYDVHPLRTGRPLVLGGVSIPAEAGLDGHSDADVLVHALMDAMLGAAALPDIGQQFPDTDEAYRHADSCALLEQVQAKLAAGGWCLDNADCVIAAESPRLAPFFPAMKTRLASVLGVSEPQLGIKATTTEGLGFVGRGEGIAAWCVVMIRGAS